MSFIARALVVLSALAASLPADAEAFRNVSVGSPAPALTLDDGRTTLPASGRVTVIVFWRPGQPFSEDALADLAAMAPALAAKGVTVAVIAESGSAAARPARVPFPTLGDPDRRAADLFGVIVFPSTAVVDRAGVLRAYLPSRGSSYRGVVEAHVARALGEISETELGTRLGALGEVYGASAERAQAAYKRGTVAAADRRYDEAARELAQAIALQPGFVDAHLQLGHARLEMNEPRQALAEFEFVLAKNPGSPGARVGAAIARVRLGQVDEGIRQMEEAVVLNPEPVRGHYELARAYEARGDVNRAIYHYRWAFLKLLQGRK